MFGFLRPQRNHRTYRQAYARCCQIQHSHFGISTLPALSYEAVSLYVLCLDAGLVDRPESNEPLCCRLRVRPTTVDNDSDSIGRYCASVGVLLVEVKLDDDVRDGWSPIPRFLRWWFRRKFQRAHDVLNQFNHDLLPRLNQQIAKHLVLEQERSVALTDYVQPTARCFGEFFASICHPSQSPHQAAFRQIGELIGAALIAFDCASDWWSDARRGLFNPVTSKHEADEALVESSRLLCEAAVICRQQFGVESETSRLLVSRAESLLKRVRTQSMCREELERQGFEREPGYSYAYCDGCDCGGCDCDCGGCDVGGCDCGGCDAGAADGTADCGGCSGCGGEVPDVPDVPMQQAQAPSCVPICFVGDCGADVCGECCCFWTERKSEQTSTDQSKTQPDEMVGKVGHAVTQLTPSGIVQIDGERHTATATDQFVDTGAPIRVMSVAHHGLVVEPYEENSAENDDGNKSHG